MNIIVDEESARRNATFAQTAQPLDRPTSDAQKPLVNLAARSKKRVHEQDDWEAVPERSRQHDHEDLDDVDKPAASKPTDKKTADDEVDDEDSDDSESEGGVSLSQ